MKFLQDILRLVNSDKVLTWKDFRQFMSSDIPWYWGIVMSILVAMATCENALFVLFYWDYGNSHEPIVYSVMRFYSLLQ